MSEYLSKEEIRRWRSSLERITLEEYAARLGKIIQEEKHDDSLVDSVMMRSLSSMTPERYMPKTEKIQSLTIKSFAKEKSLKTKLNTNNDLKQELQEIKQEIEQEIQTPVQESKIEPVIEIEKAQAAQNVKDIKEVNNTETLHISDTKKTVSSKEEEIIPIIEETVKYSFNKPLTSREQLVFDHFLSNKNTIVYAKDLAKILELPRDYVYKYIKNLRTKLNEDILQNADNGGYMLKV